MEESDLEREGHLSLVVVFLLCFAPFALLCSGFEFGSPAPSFLANHLFLLLVFYRVLLDSRVCAAEYKYKYCTAHGCDLFRPYKYSYENCAQIQVCTPYD